MPDGQIVFCPAFYLGTKSECFAFAPWGIWRKFTVELALKDKIKTRLSYAKTFTVNYVVTLKKVDLAFRSLNLIRFNGQLHLIKSRYT